MDQWNDLEPWWREELIADTAYESVVTPLLLEVLDAPPDARLLDLGCGDGRVMRAVAADGLKVVGVELVPALARTALRNGPVVVGRLPEELPFRTASFDGAYLVLVLEHVEDHQSVFESVARVVRPGGSLSLVINHPAWTAPGSTPITDDDGEVLWRPGGYFDDQGFTEVPAGDDTVVFFHRTTASLLNSAASAGWALEVMEERPHHELDDQSGIPRLLACRWRLIP